MWVSPWYDTQNACIGQGRKSEAGCSVKRILMDRIGRMNGGCLLFYVSLDRMYMRYGCEGGEVLWYCDARMVGN